MSKDEALEEFEAAVDLHWRTYAAEVREAEKELAVQLAAIEANAA